MSKRMAQRREVSLKHGMGMCQIHEELDRAYSRVEKAQPEVFVEIGSRQGGSFYIYAGACKPGATVIAVDMQLTEELLRGAKLLEDEGYRVEVVEGDSTLERTIGLVRQVLKGTPVDFLHIDGDHREATVRADWENYGVLVRPGGIVAFHDIHPDHKDAEAHRVWEPLKGQYRTEEIFGAKGKIGIGLLWK